MMQILGGQERLEPYHRETFEDVHAADLTGGYHVSCDVRFTHSHIHGAVYKVVEPLLTVEIELKLHIVLECQCRQVC